MSRASRMVRETLPGLPGLGPGTGWMTTLRVQVPAPATWHPNPSMLLLCLHPHVLSEGPAEDPGAQGPA